MGLLEKMRESKSDDDSERASDKAHEILQIVGERVEVIKIGRASCRERV